MSIQKKLALIIIFCRCINVSAQKQDIHTAPFYYEVSGLVYVYNYDIGNRHQLTSFKIPKSPLKFEVVRKERNDTGRYNFVILKFLPIVNDIVSNAGVKMSLNNNSQYVNSEDNKKYFWMREDELHNMVAEKTVRKHFKLVHDISYGANISLPLKLRPQLNGQNIRFSPDISLGGYVGFRHRISTKEPLYISFPYVQLGLATLPLTADTDGSIPHKGDGIVLGLTGSTGIVFQFKDFQLGFLAGRDKAIGEIGKLWIYNNRTWYGLSLGYSFLGNADSKD